MPFYRQTTPSLTPTQRAMQFTDYVATSISCRGQPPRPPPAPKRPDHSRQCRRAGPSCSSAESTCPACTCPRTKGSVDSAINAFAMRHATPPPNTPRPPPPKPIPGLPGAEAVATGAAVVAPANKGKVGVAGVAVGSKRVGHPRHRDRMQGRDAPCLLGRKVAVGQLVVATRIIVGKATL